jgi:hypothetical protein
LKIADVLCWFPRRWRTVDVGRLKEAVATMPEWKTRLLRSVLENARWFAGEQIRNVAAIGGNICTASPISDLNARDWPPSPCSRVGVLSPCSRVGVLSPCF